LKMMKKELRLTKKFTLKRAKDMLMKVKTIA